MALTASVAHEVATQGITVNAVCPGPTDTRMWQAPGDEASFCTGQSLSPNGGDVMW